MLVVLQIILVEVSVLISQAVEPTLTVVPSWKPAPVIVNKAPALDPVVGEIDEITGVTSMALLRDESN